MSVAQRPACEPPGWVLTAVACPSPGRECLEIKCRSAVIPTKDGPLDRTGLCLNADSVKVKIVDTCPCNYPNSASRIPDQQLLCPTSRCVGTLSPCSG